MVIQLDDVQDMFTEPEFEPFQDNRMATSGMEYIANHLKSSRLTQPIRALIFLPQARIQPGLTEHLRKAVRRFCQYRIEASQNELTSMRWQAVKALQSGLIFLGVCLLCSTLSEGAEFLPEWIRRLAGEGFLIAGWVSLWHPIELLLYEWWPHWREIQVYKRLLEMDVLVEGSEPSA